VSEHAAHEVDGRPTPTVGDKDNFLLAGSVELRRPELEALGADVDVRTTSNDPATRRTASSSATAAGRSGDHCSRAGDVG